MSGKNPNGVFVRSGFACAQCPDDATNWVVVGVLAAGTLAGLGYLVALHSFAALPGDFSAFGALPAFPTRACARHHLRLCSCFPLTGFASPSFSHRCYGSENAGVAHANARCAGHLQGQRNRDLQRMGGENKCHRRGVTYIHARREVFARVADLRPLHPKHGASASRNWHCRVIYDTTAAIERCVRRRRQQGSAPAFKGKFNIPRWLAPFKCMRTAMTPTDTNEWYSEYFALKRLAGVATFLVFFLCVGYTSMPRRAVPRYRVV